MCKKSFGVIARKPACPDFIGACRYRTHAAVRESGEGCLPFSAPGRQASDLLMAMRIVRLLRQKTSRNDRNGTCWTPSERGTQRATDPLLLLVTHLAQSLLALMRRHLVPFTLFSAGHRASLELVMQDNYCGVKNTCCSSKSFALMPSAEPGSISIAFWNHFRDSSRCPALRLTTPRLNAAV